MYCLSNFFRFWWGTENDVIFMHAKIFRSFSFHFKLYFRGSDHGQPTEICKIFNSQISSEGKGLNKRYGAQWHWVGLKNFRSLLCKWMVQIVWISMPHQTTIMVHELSLDPYSLQLSNLWHDYLVPPAMMWPK